ncbi:YbfB/YjiJ family MFS transporter [Janthinobacterium sp. 1_2014MBL_MicDiv]|uniref:YbfB/YjiJ family MFS transporter n=1 Tax=Janthinobacterium sp. 1_2014MBL_MicDiv TaxID=1644131 RepID=UPI0008F4B0B4|nr:YbfB/YjiJ family MFS transporter [Janthinobacterium sp. 1_2014MBL_MicDiv]APA68749.1 MFS transporter [Janthinobacterium sp. 1_2014MBL_MicDiv]
MPTHDHSPAHPLATALALSLGAAVALGLSRFSYGLLLPPMRADLGWSYLLAGAMNTFNALGYFLGALATPALMRRLGVWRLLVAGSVLASIFMLMSGLVSDTTVLFLQRVCAGVASAFMFIAGGVLAARLGSMHGRHAGFYIGLYYGGTGFGIALSALLVPAALASAQEHGAAHAWQWPWLALGIACLLATAIMALPAKAIGEAPRTLDTPRRFAWRDFTPSLAGYFMFGVGYIGYMTFVIALLKQQGMPPTLVTVFYTLLGLAVVASSRIWARMLDRYQGGESLAILNGVLGTVTILPALTSFVPVVFISGLVFGAVFLSVVASTTALVRHNLPQASWTAGISAYTTVFALGQIVGPIVVGWIADGPAGLERGLIASAIALFIGAALAARQKALATAA